MRFGLAEGTIVVELEVEVEVGAKTSSNSFCKLTELETDLNPEDLLLLLEEEFKNDRLRDDSK